MSLRGQPNMACTLFRHSLQFYNFAPCPHIPLLQVAAPCVRRRGSRGCGSAVGSRSGEARRSEWTRRTTVSYSIITLEHHGHLHAGGGGVGLEAPWHRVAPLKWLTAWFTQQWQRERYEIGKINCKREKLHACIKHHCWLAESICST